MKPCSSLIAALPLLCAMASCTEVDLCQAEHPHRSFMDFRFHWKEEYQGNRPDSMGVIAVRPVNILRYEFRITAEESHNNGILMQPETERQPSADTLAPAGTHNLWVRSGEYNFATFGWDEGELVDATDIVDAQGDAATLGSGLTPLYLTYRHYPVDDPKVARAYGEWKDYNAYSDFISSEGVPVCYARVDHVSVPLAQEGTGQVVVDFTPEPLTQDVSFVFHIEKKADVVVDSLTAEISGIPSTMELTTGLILAQKTYKLLFRPTYAALPSAADSASAEALRCEASVNIPGIVRSHTEDMVTGPGILQIAIYTHYDYEEEGTQRKAAKVFHAGINLYHTLKERKSLQWDEEENGYRQASRSITVEIGSPLNIDKDGILNGGSTSTGLDQWIPGETFEIEV